jgi:Trypsin
MRKLIPLITALAATLFAAAPSDAVVGGAPDGSGHPYVAAIGQPDGGGIVFTGVAISPNVVLTVAHGARRLEGATGSDQARVTFDPVATNSSTWYTGTIHINPNWNAKIGIGVGDLAVITFANPLPVTPASLPTAGLLDQLGQPGLLASRFNVVGYGLTRFLGGANGGGLPQPDFASGGTRKIDRQFFLSFDANWVWFHMPDGDQLCPGDSGSPSLLGNTNVIAGISLGGIGGIESGCSSSSSVTDTRLDTLSSRAFIGQYVTLP